MDEIIKELHGYMFTIQSFEKDNAEDGNALNKYLIELTQFMARANTVMADYGRIFRQQKKQAYLDMMASQVATQKYFSPSQGKDFVDAVCDESGYIYDTAERCSRLCTHTIEAIRTIISALKAERVAQSYGG